MIYTIQKCEGNTGHYYKVNQNKIVMVENVCKWENTRWCVLGGTRKDVLGSKESIWCWWRGIKCWKESVNTLDTMCPVISNYSSFSMASDSPRVVVRMCKGKYVENNRITVDVGSYAAYVTRVGHIALHPLWTTSMEITRKHLKPRCFPFISYHCILCELPYRFPVILPPRLSYKHVAGVDGLFEQQNSSDHSSSHWSQKQVYQDRQLGVSDHCLIVASVSRPCGGTGCTRILNLYLRFFICRHQEDTPVLSNSSTPWVTLIPNMTWQDPLLSWVTMSRHVKLSEVLIILFQTLTNFQILGSLVLAQWLHLLMVSLESHH